MERRRPRQELSGLSALDQMRGTFSEDLDARRVTELQRDEQGEHLS
jgi:hypothetical protein